MSAFKKLEEKLEKKGMSEKAAAGTAANIGRAKYGNKTMAEASKEHKPAASIERRIKKHGM